VQARRRPAPEQTVYSLGYVVVDRIDHVRVMAGHGGMDHP
jgi:hypothetical protein